MIPRGYKRLNVGKNSVPLQFDHDAMKYLFLKLIDRYFFPTF